MKARENWVAQSNKNPHGRVSSERCMEGAEVSIKEASVDELVAPEEEFVELSAWQEEMKSKLPPELQKKNVLPTPEMFGLEEATETFRGTSMKGVNVMSGKAGHFKRHKKDTTAVVKKHVLDTGMDQLEQDQSDTKFSCARTSTLASAKDVAKAVADAVLFLVAEAPSGPAEVVDLSVNMDSDAEDRAADAAVESLVDIRLSKPAMGSAYSSPRGGGKPAPSSAKPKVGTQVAPTRARAPIASSNSSPSKLSTSTAKKRSAPVASAARSAKGAKADAFNEKEAEDFIARLKTDLNEVKNLGPFMDITVAKTLVEFQKNEKKRQREAQALASKAGARLKDKGFRIAAPEHMIADLTSIKDDSDSLFKTCKAVCQASTTAPYEILSHIDELRAAGVTVPAQYHLCGLRFVMTDKIKYSKFDEVGDLVNDDECATKMIDGGMCSGDNENFFFGEVVDMNTKIMKAVTVGDVQKMVADKQIAQPPSIQRLVTLVKALDKVKFSSVTEAMPLNMALVSPTTVPVDVLGQALDDIAKDQPSPLLAPYTGCPGGKAMIQNAVTVYEAREDERNAIEHIKLGEQIKSMTQQDLVSSEEVAALLVEWREAERSLGGLDDQPAELRERRDNMTKFIDGWFRTSLLHTLAKHDSDAMIVYSAQIADGQVVDNLDFTSSEELGNMEKFMNDDMRSTTRKYLEMLKLLSDMRELVARIGTVGCGNACADEAGKIIKKFKDTYDANLKGLLLHFGFAFPTEFVDLMKSKVAAVTNSKFASLLGQLCDMAYPNHFSVKDNNALSSTHNSAITKLCNQVQQSAALCLGEEEAAREQARVEFLRKLCTVDITRRLVMQVKAKISGAKQDAVNISGVNLALGRFSKAFSAIVGQEEKLTDCIEWCLAKLPVAISDPAAKKEFLLDVVKGWETLKNELTTSRSDFIKKSVQTHADEMKNKVAELPETGSTEETHKSFISKMTENKTSESTSKFENAFATARKALAEVCATDTYQMTIDTWWRELVAAKTRVAEFGALALLYNPLLKAKGVKGQALRKQLSALHAAMAPGATKGQPQQPPPPGFTSEGGLPVDGKLLECVAAALA